MSLTIKEKVSYGLGAVGKDMVYCVVSSFLLYYYNTVLGISATFIGVLFLCARIFDAFNDPLMGVIVEKTNTRMGKFRPWLLVGTVLSALCLYAMYSVPSVLSGTSLLVYVSIAYILWGVTYTIMDIPYWSMIPAITTNGKDRENISVIARSCAGVGFAIPTALTMVLVPLLGKGSDRLGFQVLAGIIALVFIATISITVLNVKEKIKVAEKSPRIGAMIKSLFKNDQALVVVITIVLFNASLYLTSQLAIYFFEFDIGNRALFGLFGTVGGATQILSMLLLPVFRKKMSRKTIFTSALLITISGYALLFILGSLKINNLILLCAAAIIIYFGFGLATVLTTVFLADSVDYGEYKTQQRNESVVFSMQTFVVKLASAFSALLAGIGLDLIHLNPQASVQTESTLQGLRVFMIIVPIIGLSFAILIFRKKYFLSEEYIDEIQKQLGQKS